MELPAITPCQMISFREHLIREERSNATLEKYLREVGRFASFLGTGEITKPKVLAYRDRLLEQYQAGTVNGMLSAINSFLAFAGMRDCAVKLLEAQRRTFLKEERELTEAEYPRLLQAAKQRKSQRLYYLMMTLGSTGIRVSELKFITVKALKAGFADIRLKGKNRTILLPRELTGKLKQYILRTGISNGPVFQTKGGKPLDRSNICHEMKQLCHETGIDKRKVFPHNLRHLFARCFYAIEKNLSHLADILGHSSIETTRIYVATSLKAQEKIFRKMQLIL